MRGENELRLRSIISSIMGDMLDRILNLHWRRVQIRKYKDPRRKSIYLQVQLSDEQKKEIDKLFVSTYGKKVPYTWHRHFTAFTGRFDPKYIPELLYGPEFEYYMNVNKHYCKAMADKNFLPFVASSVQDGVRMPRTILSATFGAYRDQDYCLIDKKKAVEILINAGEMFAKPTVGSSSGRGSMLINMQNGRDAFSGKSAEEILSDLGRNFVVQKRMKCHKSIAAIYAGSLNSFRIITYRWKNKIEHMPVIMRIGQGGSYVDNAHAGGMFIAVSEEGILHETAFTEFKKEFKQHPDSGLVFKGHRIEGFYQMIESAERMHEAVPQIGCVNWDFTLDEDCAPVLVEANISAGSIWLAEMAHGCGVFGEKTEEVLTWLGKIRKLPKSKRDKYYFGYNESDT